MLLPDMTHQEIRKNLRRDLQEIMDRADKINRNIERKILTLNEDDEYVPYIRYMTTKNKIKWVVRYAMKPGKKDDVGISLGTFYHNRKGLRYVSFDPHDYKMGIYNSHFFRRYNERLELNLDDDIQSIYKVYVKRNLDCNMIVETKKLKNGLIEQMTQIPDGLKFGKKNVKTRTTVWNTFISNKEYKGNQGTYRGKIVDMLNFVDRMGVAHKLDQDEIGMYQLFRKNVGEDQNVEAEIITNIDLPLPISKKDRERLAKQKEIADKVLLALTDKNGAYPKVRGIFSVK